MTVPSNEMNKLAAAPGLTEQEAAFLLDVFQQPATKLDVIVGVWTVPEEIGLVWPVGTYKWVPQASLRARLMQALTAAPVAPQSATISTWRERIGQAADFPLHVPTDVERAMVAEIAELRAAAPAVSTVTLTGHQLVSALDLLAPGLPRDREELDGDLTFGVVRHKDDDGAVATGMCCWNDDTDGVLPLDEFPVKDCAAPMVADPAGVAFDREEFIRQVSVSVAEMDRDSPEDQPEMMLVTPQELQNVMRNTFESFDEDAELAGAATVKAVPSEALAGFVLVPVVPSDAMVAAGGHANSEWLNDNAPIGEARYCMPMKSVWDAMVNATKIASLLAGKTGGAA